MYLLHVEERRCVRDARPTIGDVTVGGLADPALVLVLPQRGERLDEWLDQQHIIEGELDGEDDVPKGRVAHECAPRHAQLLLGAEERRLVLPYEGAERAAGPGEDEVRADVECRVDERDEREDGKGRTPAP